MSTTLTAQSLVGPASQQARRVSLEALGLQREQVERLFLSDLDGLSAEVRSETVEAMSAATSPLTWEYLRRSRGLSMQRARAVVKRTISALLRVQVGR